MTKKIKQCGFCRFYVPIMEGKDKEGTCKRYPPSANERIVRPLDWCGEFIRMDMEKIREQDR